MNLPIELQPWQRPLYISFGVLRLHEEIIDFCNYIKPTFLENKVRLLLVDKISKVIKERWPNVSINIFGSFATGLYLPTSDIDIVVFGQWATSPLRTVEKILRLNHISTDIKVIEKATVPIVKFVDNETGIYVDISFNKDNGVKSIKVIHEYLSRYSHLEPLFLIVKHFMLQRDLNEVWTGGMGSYSLMLLCVSFLQHHNKNYNGQMNLGCLLIEFFELYGRNFNFLNTAITVTNKGSYKLKYDNNTRQKLSFISIDDPIDKEHDVARSCFGLFNIRTAFSNAYCKLYSKVIPACLALNNDGSTEIPHNDSVLASIVSVSSDIVELRERICLKFGHLVNFERDKMDFCKPPKIQQENVDEKMVLLKKRGGRKSGVKQIENGGKNKTAVKKKAAKKVIRKTQKNVVKRINKAHNWSDLAEWSQDYVFNCHS